MKKDSFYCFRIATNLHDYGFRQMDSVQPNILTLTFHHFLAPRPAQNSEQQYVIDVTCHQGRSGVRKKCAQTPLCGQVELAFGVIRLASSHRYKFLLGPLSLLLFFILLFCFHEGFRSFVFCGPSDWVGITRRASVRCPFLVFEVTAVLIPLWMAFEVITVRIPSTSLRGGEIFGRTSRKSGLAWRAFLCSAHWVAAATAPSHLSLEAVASGKNTLTVSRLTWISRVI